MEKMQKNADYYEKSADCAAGIGKNMRYDTIFLMRTEKKSHVIYKKDITGELRELSKLFTNFSPNHSSPAV